jgi:phosphoribosylglycinamide synthetase, ATP-grasp (A) domain
MKKVVIIGANDFQNPLILKAKELGYETHVFAWKDGSIGEKTADYFYPISIVEKDKILKECKKIKPQAIASIGSDLASITVNYLAYELGLPCNNPKYSEQCTNKYEMRKVFLENGVVVPQFVKLGKDDEVILNEFEFPVIVKPTDRSGSRGIFLCKNIEEVKEAIPLSAELSFEKKAIVEEYISGNEYSCEGITQNGEHHILTFTKKYTTGAPHFIETGHKQPSDLTEEQQKNISEIIKKALTALKIENSASHAEFKIDEKGRIRIIEIGARMGGDCIGSHLVKISTGYDFVKMVLDVALGNKIKLVKVDKPQNAIIKFIFNDEDIKKYEIIKSRFPEEICYETEIKKDDLKITDSSSRKGYFILNVDDEKLKKIESELKKEGINSIL